MGIAFRSFIPGHNKNKYFTIHDLQFCLISNSEIIRYDREQNTATVWCPDLGRIVRLPPPKTEKSYRLNMREAIERLLALNINDFSNFHPLNPKTQ